MRIKDLAQEIHENAVQHGWWDDERSEAEITALIHSEWSEALEEARAGHPDAYVLAGDGEDEEVAYIERGQDGIYCRGNKVYSGKKPEGVCVEIIDGVIRILDRMGRHSEEIDQKYGNDAQFETFYESGGIEANRVRYCGRPGHETWDHLYCADWYVSEKAAEVICDLHYYTANDMEHFALALALQYVHRRGIDPLELLLEKHAYNKGRPYRHGKLF